MQAIETAAARLASAGVPFERDVPLGQMTTFQIGGPAAIVVSPQTPAQLAAARQIAQQLELPAMVLGKGSNVLFSDDGYPGVIFNIGSGMAQITVEGNTITAGAGADLAAVCRAAEKAALAGLEFAFGIPGSVGGAVYMNAGAYGGEMADVLESVEYLDEQGLLHTAPAHNLALGYRQSIFHQRAWCVVTATLRLQPGNRQEISARMRDFMQRRADKQPLDLPSAGSAFKRPPGAFAGALIDECGLRGYRVGGAAISEKHCGFIVNMGGATCADVVALAQHVCDTVQTQTGYTLEKEVRVIAPEN